MELKLTVPSAKNKAAAENYKEEFVTNGELPINGGAGLERYERYDDWLEKLARDRDPSVYEEGRVDADTYFLTNAEETRIYGMINVRRSLNEYLYNYGGHIGYSIRRSERKKGYATLMLSLALDVLKAAGYDKILVTCDKNNAFSARVIVKNGGVLENEVTGSDLAEVVQRYFIALR